MFIDFFKLFFLLQKTVIRGGVQNSSEISEGGAVVHSSVCMCDDSTITTTTNTTHTSHTSTTTYKDSEMANRERRGWGWGGDRWE